MPYISVYIHFVWSTKNRTPYLNTQDLRKTVWAHIKENAKNKHIFIDTINGYHDHCHCLISFGADQTMTKTMQLIKGESSFWINKNKLCQQKFEWQDEYFAKGVDSAALPRVRKYIRNQEEHHRVKSFQDDIDTLDQQGFQKFIDGQ